MSSRARYSFERRAARKKFKTLAIAIGAVVGLCVATAAASRTWGALIGYPGFMTPSIGKVAFEINRKRASDTLSLALLLTFAPIAVLGFAIAVNRKRSLHGDARWGTLGDAGLSGLLASQGVCTGRLKGVPLIAENAERGATHGGHVVVIAPTGSGKGRGVIIPTLLQWPGSAVVTDLKLENYEKTSGYRKRAGKVFCFNPISPNTHCYNPLSVLTPGPSSIDELERIAAILIPHDGTGTKMWVSQARDLFKGVALHLFAKNGEVTCEQILKFVQSGEQLAEQIKRLWDSGEIVDPEAARLLRDFAAGQGEAAKTVRGVIMELTGALNVFANPYVAAATSRCDFTFRDLRRTPTTIYIGITMENLDRFGPLVALLYQQMVDAMARNEPGTDEPHWVLAMIDEFPQLPRMDVMVKAMAILRSYRVRIVAIVQDPSQLRSVYGADRASEIEGNMAFQVLMRPNTLEVARQISDRLGFYTVKKTNSSRSHQSGKTSASRSESDERRALMLPQEILQLDDDDVIVYAPGAPAFRAQKIKYDQEQSLITRLLRPVELPATRVDAAALINVVNERELVMQLFGHDESDPDHQTFLAALAEETETLRMQTNG